MHVHIVKMCTGWFICMKMIISGWAHLFLAVKLWWWTLELSVDFYHHFWPWAFFILSLFLLDFSSILLSHPRLYSVSITLRGQCCQSVCRHWAVSETKKNIVYLSFSLFRPLSFFALFSFTSSHDSHVSLATRYLFLPLQTAVWVDPLSLCGV